MQGAFLYCNFDWQYLDNMKPKKKKNEEDSVKTEPDWMDLKDFIQRKKEQNKALKKIIDRIDDNKQS